MYITFLYLEVPSIVLASLTPFSIRVFRSRRATAGQCQSRLFLRHIYSGSSSQKHRSVFGTLCVSEKCVVLWADKVRHSQLSVRDTAAVVQVLYLLAKSSPTLAMFCREKKKSKTNNRPTMRKIGLK